MTRLDCIHVGEWKLAVRKQGDPSNPALVLLHGWPQTSLAWERVLDDLGRDQYALAFDLPGVGGSQGRPQSAEKHVLGDVILSAAEQAGAKDIIVVGYDVGGMVAFACARDHAGRVKGAVVMNTVIPGIHPWKKVLSDPRIFHFAFHNVPELPEVLVSGQERAYFDFFYDIMAGNPDCLTEDARSEYVRGYSTFEALKTGFEWYRAMEKDAERNAKPVPISTPVLYVRGDADPGALGIGAYAAGLRHAGVKRLETETLPNSGEYAPEEAPEELVAALRRFRASLTRIAR